MTIPKGDYALLQKHLENAYQQASSGKGKERHANNDPFDQQPICVIGRLLNSFDGELYQAIKKATEAKRLLSLRGKDAAKAELYGAINYLAAACILIDEMQ